MGAGATLLWFNGHARIVRNPWARRPIPSARRGGRPALRRRFYAKAATASGPAGEVVCLDDKPIHTPARRVSRRRRRRWPRPSPRNGRRKRDVIDPATMPLTRLANSIIDGVADLACPVTAEIEKYIASDLLFYRADGPRELRERQAQHWDPILAWAREALGAQFNLGEGIVYVAQPEAALSAARAAIPEDPWRLGALHAVTTLTGSALIALAMLRGALSADAAWQAAKSTRIGISSNGARTRWRSNDARSASPNCMRRRRCLLRCRINPVLACRRHAWRRRSRPFAPAGWYACSLAGMARLASRQTDAGRP